MTMISKRKVLAGLIVAAGGLVWAAPAAAQPSRTWVSGVGNDMNSCSRTAPCRTFAAAILKTAPAGEITCLDPGSYGSVTIGMSISIICQPSLASVFTPEFTTAIIINAAATDTIFLSGLDIHGGGGIHAGLFGIRILAAGVVHIQDSIIRSFTGADRLGLRITPFTATQVTVSDTTIADNDSGILLRPLGAGGSARLTLRNVRLQNNVNNQLTIDTTGNTGPGISLFVDDSQILGGTNGISINQPAGTATVTSMVTDSFIALCSGSGLITAGSNTVRMRVSDTTITACGTGVTQGGTTIINTYGNNRTDGNGAPGAFTVPALPES